jgi:hypothetical protein
MSPADFQGMPTRGKPRNRRKFPVPSLFGRDLGPEAGSHQTAPTATHPTFIRVSAKGEYYNADRVHTSIGEAPAGRVPEAKPSDSAPVVGFPRVGGLHQRYAWREAA